VKRCSGTLGYKDLAIIHPDASPIMGGPFVIAHSIDSSVPPSSPMSLTLGVPFSLTFTVLDRQSSPLLMLFSHDKLLGIAKPR